MNEHGDMVDLYLIERGDGTLDFHVPPVETRLEADQVVRRLDVRFPALAPHRAVPFYRGKEKGRRGDLAEDCCNETAAELATRLATHPVTGPALAAAIAKTGDSQEVDPGEPVGIPDLVRQFLWELATCKRIGERPDWMDKEHWLRIGGRLLRAQEDSSGTVRLPANRVVRNMVEHGGYYGHGLTEIVAWLQHGRYSTEEVRALYLQIGYSVSGLRDLEAFSGAEMDSCCFRGHKKAPKREGASR